MKEQERIWHIIHCKAHTGPVYLVNRYTQRFGQQLREYANRHESLYDETYEDEYILPFIHICSNTLTEASNKYEYVEKVTSLWDYASPYYLEIKDYNYNDLEKIFNMKKKELKKITILEVSKSNQIKRIKINDIEYTGEEFKSLLNLKSADINMIINPTHIRFITKGWGNNMGLSQFGSNELAKQELSYIKILNYYFPKVKIKRYI